MLVLDPMTDCALLEKKPTVIASATAFPSPLFRVAEASAVICSVSAMVAVLATDCGVDSTVGADPVARLPISAWTVWST